MPEGLVSLKEAAELAGLNPNNRLAAAHRAACNRVEVVAQKDRETQLYIREAEMPRFLGADHPIMRGGGDWQLALREQRRAHVRELKSRAAAVSRAVRLDRDVERVRREFAAARALLETRAVVPKRPRPTTSARTTRSPGRLVALPNTHQLDRLRPRDKAMLLRKRVDLVAQGESPEPVDRILRANGLIWEPSRRPR